MIDLLKKNFQSFVSYIKNKNEAQEAAKEEGIEFKDETKPDLDIFDRLKKTNGKQPAAILLALFQGLFDENIETVKLHIPAFIKALVENKIFEPKDYSKGLSKLVQNFGEISMDVPKVHDYTYTFVIKPLTDIKCLNMKFVDWVPPPPRPDERKEEDDEDPDFDSSDSQFKLMALILNDPKLANRELEQSFKTAAGKRRDKIDDAEGLWADIRESLGGGADSDSIIAMLKE